MSEQRFYYRYYDGDSRWYVFMGDKNMEEQGKGLLVANVGYEGAAQSAIKEYTRQFNEMIGGSYARNSGVRPAQPRYNDGDEHISRCCD